MTTYKDKTRTIPWKFYLGLTLESLLCFYLATFSFAMFFKFRGSSDLSMMIILGVLYLFVIVCCGIRLIKKLPLAALMLLIPIAPFIALALIMSLIPLLQIF